MLALLGVRSKELVTVEPGDDDWYANLIWLDRRKCLLLVHAGTLFSVFVPDARKSGLVPVGPSVVALIHRELETESLPLDRLGILNSSAIAFAKTDSLAACDARELNRQAISQRSSVWRSGQPRFQGKRAAGSLAGDDGVLWHRRSE